MKTVLTIWDVIGVLTCIAGIYYLLSDFLIPQSKTGHFLTLLAAIALTLLPYFLYAYRAEKRQRTERKDV